MQKEYGLKSIQENYFNSIFIIKNYFIFPGGKLIIFFIFLSLLFKLLNERIKKIGTFIIHIGILLFILFTFLFLRTNEEKYIIIKEKESNNTVINNNIYDITFIINEKKIKVNSTNLKIKTDLSNLPFNIIIKNSFENTNAKINNNFDKDFLTFKKIKYFVENEYNKTAFEINFIDNNNKLIYKTFLIENITDDINIKINNNKINIKLEKNIELLPFNIYLENFKKINYNGSKLAKSFESDVVITDKNIKWKYNIKMNHPLRYKNYIFYQSSFIEDEKKSTILYVVNNSKINYIYLSCFIILTGFIIHIINRTRKNYE